MWWATSTPVANFLLQRGRLDAQLERNVLPAPTPLMTKENPYLRRLHLEAAVHEGDATEDDLRWMFDKVAVDELIEKRRKATREGRRAWFDASRGVVVRSALLRPVAGAVKPSTSRATITDVGVDIVDAATGRSIHKVDSVIAPTHYHPYRVLEHQGRLLQVRSGGDFDRAAMRIAVHDAPAGAACTLPELRFTFAPRQWLTEMDRRRDEDVQLRIRRAEVDIVEAVHAAISASRVRTEFPPVEARYRSQLLVVYLDHLRGHAGLERGLAYVAQVIDDLVLVHLRADDAAVEVEHRVAGFADDTTPALLFVDRTVGGLGVSETLDLDTLCNLLRWARSMMKACPCPHGCLRCAPPEVIDLKAKQDAIKILGG